MKNLLIIIATLFSFTTQAEILKVMPESSSLNWHIHIKSNTDVYGDIKNISGEISLKNQTGKLIFDLASTKSFEMDDKEKEFSEARDERIQSITSSKINVPVFSIIKIIKKDNLYQITGELSLNGVKKVITIKTEITQSSENNFLLKAKHNLNYKDFDISNPVIWILRATSTPEDFIRLNFNIKLKKE